ncbi:terminase family protein [Methylocapsa sp. D3K7]|uniref:DNA-packaging protein n=1 Tax=Methylocapsa sp. D3K7 TaxID=3041435 RepID=UPI00244EB506|nr:terminase family protein [Methylocapsa sp. D3K7]WGJ16139.1 terminase family protein [Methylocapsa sp. D3K7]
MSIFQRLAEVLSDDWSVRARSEQLPPIDDAWNIWLILSGRAWGKTRTGAEWVKSLIISEQARRVAFIGPTAADVRDTMVEGESGLLSVCSDWDRPLYEPSKRRVTFKNGSIITLFSAEEPNRLRGPQHNFIWMDELAAMDNAMDVFNMSMFGLRLGKKPRALITTTPRPIKILKELIARPDVHVTKGKTSDNAANLAPTFLSAIVSRYEGTRLGRQELDGDILDDNPGALWSRDLIEKTRIPKAEQPEMTRIVVAIDPAVSVSETSDATGIVVAGKCRNRHGYIIEDLSGKYSPTEWARRAIAAYREHRADRIIYEQNQGGDMVAHTLRMVDQSVPLRAVHASRGKIVRAEPISAIYEQHKVHHVGCFPDLEDEMCSFEPGTKDSPDRLDAMVYALTDLQISGPGPWKIDYDFWSRGYMKLD